MTTRTSPKLMEGYAVVPRQNPTYNKYELANRPPTDLEDAIEALVEAAYDPVSTTVNFNGFRCRICEARVYYRGDMSSHAPDCALARLDSLRNHKTEKKHVK